MIRLLTIILALLFAKSVSAQYKELLNSQPDEEIKKFKKLGVKIEFISSLEGLDSSYLASYIDTTGHKVLIQKPKSKSYLKYDEKGRFIAKLDSISFRDSLIRLEYAAEYSAAGKLSMLRTPVAESIFRYDAKKKELEERYNGKNDDQQTRFYRYDAAGRIIEEEFKNPDGKIVKTQKYTYNKQGLLEKETIMDAEPDESHTFYGLTYDYDSKGNLTSKQLVTVFNHPGEHPDPNIKFLPKYLTRNYTYVYDDKGNQVKEVYTCVENPRTNFTVENKYDKNGLIVSKESFDYKRIRQLGLHYNYEFHKKKN